MVTYKVGDRVKRITGSYKGMEIGDVDYVTKINPFHITLKKFGNGHSPSALVKDKTIVENE